MFDKDAQEAESFYAATFPNSEVTAIHKSPGDFPGGKEGEILTVEFTVCGLPCVGLNGGPQFKHTEAFSFQIATDTQEETDRYWNAIVGNGGEAKWCGWCKDRWGIFWQITPRVLTDAMAAGGAEVKHAFAAMMEMARSTSPKSRQPAAGGTCFILRRAVHGFNNLKPSDARVLAVVTPALIGHRVGPADAHEDEVVEDAFRRQRKVHDHFSESRWIVPCRERSMVAPSGARSLTLSS